MQVKELSLEQVMTFGYCSMQYHFRYRLGFPWFPGSAQAAVSWAVRAATRTFFDHQRTKLTHKHGLRESAQTIDEEFGKALRAFPDHSGEIVRRQTETFTTILSHENLFRWGQDSLVAFDLEYETEMQYRHLRFFLKGTVDAVALRDFGKENEVTVIYTMVSNRDPLEDLVNLDAVREGFALQATRHLPQIDPTKQILYRTVPQFKARHSKKALTSALNKNPDFEGTFESKKDRAVQFRAIAGNAALGIASGMALPTGHPDRCRHCPYASVCSATVARADQRSAIQLRRTVMEHSAFEIYGGTS